MEFCPSVHCIHSAFQYVPSQQFWFPAKNDRYLSIFPNGFPRTSLSTLLPTQITGSDSSSLFPGFVSSKLQKKIGSIKHPSYFFILASRCAFYGVVKKRKLPSIVANVFQDSKWRKSCLVIIH